MKPSDINHARHEIHTPGAPYECTFVSHEWEELVEKLAASEDPRQREIGLREHELLKMRKQSSGVS